MQRGGVGCLVLAVVLLGACGDGDHEDLVDAADGADLGHSDAATTTDAFVGLDAELPDASDITSDGQVDLDGAQVDPDGGLVDAAADGGEEPSDACATCVAPRAGFALSVASGSAPLSVRATSEASGAAPLVEVTYDWGEGEGPTAVALHRYRAAGTFTVTQRVKDANGLTATATATLTVGPRAFTPVRFSRTDKSACTSLSSDGFEVEFMDWGPCGVRSDTAIAPGSGVYYFEARRYTEQWRGGGIGVATAAARLDEAAGSSAQSMGALANGPVRANGASCTGSDTDSALKDLGFVVDYRTGTATIYVLQGAAGAPSVRATCTLAANAPLFIFYSGDRARVGYELRINSGADTTNMPFYFGAAQVKAALTAKGATAAAMSLVMGFGKTHAGPTDTPPTLTVPEQLSVPLGQSVTIEGSADDAEDGPLSSRINWVDLASPHHAPVRGSGRTFTFTPSYLGRHPVEASVEDADGRVTRKTVLVKVTGTLPRFNPVQLTRDALTGPGIELSANGLSARFNAPGKNGVRANQGLYGRFWYFEVHRDSPAHNMGMGLVVADGALNPYAPPTVPWSCSLNVIGGLWVNLIGAGGWEKNDANEYFGFAVDYRGEHPLVYIIANGKVQGPPLHLTDVWIPVYPMLYADPPEFARAGWDYTINFGTAPFAYNPVAILGASGVDASALELGWGRTAAVSQ